MHTPYSVVLSPYYLLLYLLPILSPYPLLLTTLLTPCSLLLTTYYLLLTTYYLLIALLQAAARPYVPNYYLLLATC